MTHTQQRRAACALILALTPITGSAIIGGAPAVFAATTAPAQASLIDTYAVTYDLVLGRRVNGTTGLTIHAIATTELHQGVRAGRHVCTLDPMHMTVSALGRTTTRMLPGSNCADRHGQGGATGFAREMDFSGIPRTAGREWTVRQTLSVRDTMIGMPIDPTIARMLPSVAWRTTYIMRSPTVITVNGVGTMTADRTSSANGARLHAHVAATSAMRVRMDAPYSQLMDSLDLRSRAAITLDVTTLDGRHVDETDTVSLHGTARPIDNR